MAISPFLFLHLWIDFLLPLNEVSQSTAQDFGAQFGTMEATQWNIRIEMKRDANLFDISKEMINESYLYNLIIYIYTYYDLSKEV